MTLGVALGAALGALLGTVSGTIPLPLVVDSFDFHGARLMRACTKRIVEIEIQIDATKIAGHLLL
jgi:hypothetical protein